MSCVAVLHAASVTGCWGRAAGAASVMVCWCASGAASAPLGSQSLSGVATNRPAGWSPETGRGADSGRADGAGTGAGAAARRTRKDRQLDLLDDNHVHVVLGLHAPGLGVGELAAILCCARPWSAFCCKLLSRRRASSVWTFCSSSARCSSSPTRRSSPTRVGLYKILFHFEALLHNNFFANTPFIDCAKYCTILPVIAPPRPILRCF